MAFDAALEVGIINTVNYLRDAQRINQATVSIEQAQAKAAKSSAAAAKDSERFSDALTKQGKAAQQAARPMDALKQQVVGMAVAYISLRGAQEALDFAKMGAGAARLSDSFRQLTTQAGESGTALLSSLHAASAGTVADTDLILGANRAMMLGLGGDSEKMGQLMEAARFRGRAMGLDTTQAFSDIVTGVGRMSPMILDNLGIVIDAETRYKEWAEANDRVVTSLSAAEKRQILLNAVLEESQKQIAAAGGVTDDTADAYERLAASWKNLMTVMATETAKTLEPVVKLLTEAADTATKLTMLTGKAAAGERAVAAYHARRGEAGYGLEEAAYYGAPESEEANRVREEAERAHMMEMLGIQAEGHEQRRLDMMAYNRSVIDEQKGLAAELGRVQQEQMDATVNAQTIIESAAGALKSYGTEGMAARDAIDNLRVAQGAATEATVAAQRGLEILSAGYAAGALTLDEYLAAIDEVRRGEVDLQDVIRSEAGLQRQQSDEVLAIVQKRSDERLAVVRDFEAKKAAEQSKADADERERLDAHLVDMQRAEEDHQASLTAMRESAAREQASVIASAEATIADAEKSLDAELEQLAEQHETRLTEIATKGNQERLDLLATFNQEQMALNARFDAERVALGERATADVTSLLGEFTREIEQRKATEERSALLATLGLAPDTDIAALTAEQLQAATEVLAAQREERLANLAETHAAELEEIQVRQDAETAILLAEQQERQAQFEASLAAELAAETVAYEQAKAAEEARAAESIATAQATKEARLVEIADELARKEASEIADYEKSKVRREQDYTAQSEARKTALLEKQAAIDADLQTALGKFDEATNAEIKEARGKYDELLRLARNYRGEVEGVLSQPIVIPIEYREGPRPTRQHGGPLAAFQTARVGEAGSEMFVAASGRAQVVTGPTLTPGEPGFVVPAHITREALGGSLVRAALPGGRAMAVSSITNAQTYEAFGREIHLTAHYPTVQAPRRVRDDLMALRMGAR